jgi:hypothetical protein
MIAPGLPAQGGTGLEVSREDAPRQVRIAVTVDLPRHFAPRTMMTFPIRSGGQENHSVGPHDSPAL